MKTKWIAGALGMVLTLPVAGQSGAANAVFMTVARRSRHGKAKAAPAVSRMQMETAQEMVRDSYAMGQGLELRQRVALMTRLLYTMRPEAMAEEKKRWAEELFGLAQQLPAGAEDAAALGISPTFAKDRQIWATNRNQAIATAATRVAVYDSDRALELLDTLPSEGGRREDARTMASRLVFAIYMEHHGSAGAQTLLEHGRKWGEHGGFPYGASAAALARLRMDEDAAEDFFRQTLAVFARRQEGVFGVREFAGLLERAAVLEAISDTSAEEAGRAVVSQLGKLAGMEGAALGNGARGTASSDVASSDTTGAASSDAAVQPFEPLTDEQKQQVAEAMNDVRFSAPKAYAQAAKDWPGLVTPRTVKVGSGNAALPAAGAESGNAALPAAGAESGNAALPAAGAKSGNAGLPAAGAGTPTEEPKVDAGLQASFGELAEGIRERRGQEALQEVIARGVQRVNARYRKGECVDCVFPDGQSWALVSLAAYGAPMTIAAQLKGIEEPFWHAYFLAIAAQQVGEPTRVADPTARRVAGKEEAEPE